MNDAADNPPAPPSPPTPAGTARTLGSTVSSHCSHAWATSHPDRADGGRPGGPRARRTGRLGRGWLAGLLGLLLTLPTLANAVAAYDVEVLLDWAERTYSSHFPGPQRTQSSPPYVYRHYPSTGNYVGVADGVVYILGPVSGGQLSPVGTVARFECEVVPENCVAAAPALQARYDLQGNAVSGGAVLARDSAGRHLVWGQSRSIAATVGTPLQGLSARLLADQALQVVVGTGSYGALLRRDGSVAEWGVFGQKAATATSALTVSLPGPAAQLGLGSYLHAILRDGSVWAQGSEVVNLDGALRRRMRQIQAPPDVVAFSSGQFQDGLLVVTRTGEVWRLPAQRVNGVSNAAAVHCTQTSCLAVQRGGGLIFWDSTPAAPRTLPAFDNLVLKQAVLLGDSTPVAVLAVGKDGQLYVMSILGGGTAQVANIGSVSDLDCTLHYCVVKQVDGTLWGWGSRLGGLYPADPTGIVGSALAPVRLPGMVVP